MESQSASELRHINHPPMETSSIQDGNALSNETKSTEMDRSNTIAQCIYGYIF